MGWEYLAVEHSEDVRFACNGCGRCCQNHHVPLTLDEALRWVGDGGQIIILIEGFIEDGPGTGTGQTSHMLKRSLAVRSGELTPRVMVTFAAYNPGRCRYLGDDNRCGQYEVRPLVCRIYPAEINPSIALDISAKECPPEVWETGPVLIQHARVADTELEALIERSRQADRDDIAEKVAICERLGISTSALRGDGFTAWLPAPEQWLAAVGQARSHERTPIDWAFEVSGQALADELARLGARMAHSAQQAGTFIALAATPA